MWLDGLDEADEPAFDLGGVDLGVKALRLELVDAFLDELVHGRRETGCGCGGFKSFSAKITSTAN